MKTLKEHKAFLETILKKFFFILHRHARATFPEIVESPEYKEYIELYSRTTRWQTV